MAAENPYKLCSICDSKVGLSCQEKISCSRVANAWRRGYEMGLTEAGKWAKEAISRATSLLKLAARTNYEEDRTWGHAVHAHAKTWLAKFAKKEVL
jgi:hypothetical protein